MSRNGPPGLHTAVAQGHGGSEVVAARIGLRLEHMRHGYWCDQENRDRELFDLMERLRSVELEHNGMCDDAGNDATLTQMLSKREMVAAGRADLAQAIERHGGFAAMARRLGLVYKGRRTRRRTKKSLCGCMRRDGNESAGTDSDTQ